MPEIRRSQKARQDLFDIAYRISADDPHAALRFLDRVEEVLHLLADHPQLGQVRPELAPDLRSFSVGRYVLYYRPTSAGLELARVIHGARDLDAFTR